MKLAKLIKSIATGVPPGLIEVARLGRSLAKRAEDILAYFDRPGTSPTTRCFVKSQFNPRGATGGKPVVRKAKVNKKGIAKVKTPARAGTYRVVVRGQGFVLRKAKLRVR